MPVSSSSVSQMELLKFAYEPDNPSNYVTINLQAWAMCETDVTDSVAWSITANPPEAAGMPYLDPVQHRIVFAAEDYPDGCTTADFQLSGHQIGDTSGGDLVLNLKAVKGGSMWIPPYNPPDDPGPNIGDPGFTTSFF